MHKNENLKGKYSKDLLNVSQAKLWPQNKLSNSYGLSCLGVDTSGREKYIRKGDQRVNMAEILCTCV
jgi:hypothetical protein